MRHTYIAQALAQAARQAAQNTPTTPAPQAYSRSTRLLSSIGGFIAGSAAYNLAIQSASPPDTETPNRFILAWTVLQPVLTGDTPPREGLMEVARHVLVPNYAQRQAALRAVYAQAERFEEIQRRLSESDTSSPHSPGLRK